MAFNSSGQYVASHKTWDHVGNLVPDVEYSEGIRPHGEFRPAAWLPVQFFDKYFEDWFVVMPGKAVAFDNQGRLVPAQYGLAGASITYTQDDVDAGVIDVRTGAPLLAADVGTFTVASVTNMMGTGEALAVSAPVGVAPYPYWQWAGDGAPGDDGSNPAHFRRHNYQLQHRTAIVCDYVLELPLVPARTAGESVAEASFAGTVSTLAPLANLPVAKVSQRTPITFANGTATDAATRFVRQVASVADIKQAGDWHIDYATGVISVYATASLGVATYLVTYSHYATAPTGAGVSKFASVLGNVKPGDFLKINQDSNWVKADPAVDGFDQILAQVLEVEDVAGKDALDRVRTAFDPPLGTSAAGAFPGTAGQLDQMPGSATGGVPDKVHYAGASNLVVRLNLISR